MSGGNDLPGGGKADLGLARRLNRGIWIVSIAVLVLVGAMQRIRIPLPDGWSTGFLAGFHAGVNVLVAAVLVFGVVCIKLGRVAWHRRAMLTALGLSALFLLSYVVYHMTNDPLRYAGVGWMRGLYLFLLGTHIVLAGLSLPFILRAFVAAWVGDFGRHRRLVRWVFPVWLYVALTGPACYLMLHG